MIRKPTIALLFLVLFFVSSCSEKNQDAYPKTLVGTWKLTMQKVGTGAPGIWTEVPDGFTYTFGVNGSFVLTESSTCTTGGYNLDGGVLQLKFDCTDYTEQLDYNYDLEGNYLLLSPATHICIEGCLYKFKKIAVKDS